MKKLAMLVLVLLAFGVASAQMIDNLIMEAGVAVVKGRIVGRPKGLPKPDLLVSDVSWPIEVAPGGAFGVRVLVPHSRVAYVRFSHPYVLIATLLTPGDTVDMTIDYAKLPANSQELIARQFVKFAGPNAKLNNELGKINLDLEYMNEISLEKAVDTLATMTLAQQGQYLWDCHQALVSRINENKMLSPETRLFLNVRADHMLLYAIDSLATIEANKSISSKQIKIWPKY